MTYRHISSVSFREPQPKSQPTGLQLGTGRLCFIAHAFISSSNRKQRWLETNLAVYKTSSSNGRPVGSSGKQRDYNISRWHLIQPYLLSQMQSITHVNIHKWKARTTLREQIVLEIRLMRLCSFLALKTFWIKCLHINSQIFAK